MNAKTGAITIALMSTCLAGAVHAETSVLTNDGELDEVLIVAQRDSRTSTGATGLNMDIKDTPQSISVVTQDEMEKFGATNINDALMLATGINVEEWETNRTNYMSRGFDIHSTQVDGVGLPNNWGIVTGAIDSFGYEKIEVIRGANGLLTGVGNASGTINYVRKRPANDAHGEVGLSIGSWQSRRIEADYSTPFTSDRSWAGRLVVASEDGNSYLRSLKNDRTFVYGVVDGQIGEKATLAIGYSYQIAHTKGNMWGALVLANSDGTQAEFDTSVSPTQDWTRWNTINQSGFVEFTYKLSEDWTTKLTYNKLMSKSDSKLFYVYTIDGIDKDTGLGLYGWPGKWTTDDNNNLANLSVNGNFNLFGLKQQLILGMDHAWGKSTTDSYPIGYDDPAFGALPSFPYAGDVVPEPAWGPRSPYDLTNQKLDRLYGAARISFTSALSVIAGFNDARYHRDGNSTGASFDQTESKLSPYAGISYALTRNLSAYASYSDIYQPQDYYDINGRYLDPTKGVNYEAGLKADWLDKRLLTTLAWFKAQQKGLGTFAGVDGNGTYYYEGVDVNSSGYEAEVTGKLNDHMDVVLGYTALKLKDHLDADTYTWVPRHTLNLSISSKLPFYTPVAVGLNGRWQSDISTIDSATNAVIRQDAHAVLNAFASWEANKHLKLQVNVDNVANRKYIGSLYSVGYYAAPRHYSASVKWQF